MPTRQQELRDRTKRFALAILRLYRLLPYKADAQVIGKQLIRSGTSVAANYRSACRGRSKQEFTAKIGIVVEEADETVFWLELLQDSGLLKPELVIDQLCEARELTAIFTAAYSTSRART